MNNIIKLIIGMMIVTYIPRLLPFLMVNNKKLPTRIQKFLEFIPYAALGALIFPGVLTSTGNNLLAGCGGILFAIIYSWLKGGIIIPVMGSIVVALIILVI